MQMYQKMKTASSATTLTDKQRLVATGSVDKMLGKSMYSSDLHGSGGGGAGGGVEEESSIDISSPRDNNSPLVSYDSICFSNTITQIR